jgi:lysozyme
MKISTTGVNLIKSFEGLKLQAYIDAVGILTIGYGHTGPDVHKGMTITEAQATDLLHKDLTSFEAAVTKLITVPLNQNQFDALVSFTYNVGVGSLESSTLRRRLNAHEDPNTVAKQELIKWVKGNNNQTLPGLLTRRQEEIALFCKKIS